MQIRRTLVFDQDQVGANEETATIGRMCMMHLSARNASGRSIGIVWSRWRYTWIARARRWPAWNFRSWRCYAWIATAVTGALNQMGMIAGGNVAIEQRSRRTRTNRTNAHHTFYVTGTVFGIGQIHRANCGALGTVNGTDDTTILVTCIEVMSERTVASVCLTVIANNVMIAWQWAGHEDVAPCWCTDASQLFDGVCPEIHQQNCANKQQQCWFYFGSGKRLILVICSKGPCAVKSCYLLDMVANNIPICIVVVYVHWTKLVEGMSCVERKSN